MSNLSTFRRFVEASRPTEHTPAPLSLHLDEAEKAVCLSPETHRAEEPSAESPPRPGDALFAIRPGPRLYIAFRPPLAPDAIPHSHQASRQQRQGEKHRSGSQSARRRSRTTATAGASCDDSTRTPTPSAADPGGRTSSTGRLKGNARRRTGRTRRGSRLEAYRGELVGGQPEDSHGNGTSSPSPGRRHARQRDPGGTHVSDQRTSRRIEKIEGSRLR